MRAAGFDLSSHCGVGVWDGESQTPVLMPKRVLHWGFDDGLMFECWRRWIQDFFNEHRPDVVGIEAPALGMHNDAVTEGRQAGIRAFLVWACHMKQVPVYHIPVSSWRKTFIGFGSAPRQRKGGPPVPKTDWKRLALQRCRALGWDAGRDHNVAEAAGVLDHLLVAELKITPPWRAFETTAFLPLSELYPS